MADKPITSFQEPDLFSFGNRVDQPQISEVSPNEALILPCGAGKDPAACALEASKRYTGPMWQEARKAMGGSENIPKFLEEGGVDLYILSAEHGLIPADQLIEPYDTELTPQRLEEIKGDKSLTQTIRNTFAKYDPEKIRLGTPKRYTKLITDVMGRDYTSVFPEGSGSGLQKKGIVDYLKSKIPSSREVVPYEDPQQPRLPMGEDESKTGGPPKSTKWGRGIGMLARRYSPIMQLLQTGLGAWDSLDDETKQKVSDFMREPLFEKGSIDHFREWFGDLPKGGILDVANEVPDEVQLDLVRDTALSKDYESSEMADVLKNQGIGGLFDFDYGGGAHDRARRQQEDLNEFYRRGQIMDKSVDPYEKRKRQSYWGEDRYTKVARNPLLEIAGVGEETQPRPVRGNIYRQEMYRQAMGEDPKFKEGQMPQGFSERDQDFLREEGLLYPSEAPKTNYFIQPRFQPLEVPEWDKGPGAQSISGEDRRYQSFQLDQVAKDPAFHDKQLQRDPDLWQDILIKPAPWAVKKLPGGDYTGSAHPPYDILQVRITEDATKQSQMAKDLAAHNEKVIGSYERNIENAKYRINWMTENPTKFSLILPEVDDQIKLYGEGIKNIEKRISELKEQNEELTTGNFKK